jgi:hypothetical protein
MHIQIDGDNRGQYALHWRGVALTNFDGKTWSNPRAQHELERQPDAFSFAIPLFSQGVAQAYGTRSQAAPGVPARLIHYRVLLEPIGTNLFFLAPWGRRIVGPYRACQWMWAEPSMILIISAPSAFTKRTRISPDRLPCSFDPREILFLNWRRRIFSCRRSIRVWLRWQHRLTVGFQ